MDPRQLAGGAEEVGPRLLGAVLVSTLGGEHCAARIVEVEAYIGPGDPASHAAERTGRTKRNGIMFGPPGLAYIYRSYGVHWCLNVVTSAPGDPQAVLIRAAEPLAGVGAMAHRRGRNRDLCNGPGRLAQALGIDGGMDGHDLTRPPLTLFRGGTIAAPEVFRGPRVGISRAVDWPLRFWVAGNPHVSGSARGRGGIPLQSGETT